MLVPKIENTYYSSCMYMQGHKFQFQTPVINSWLDLGKKSKFKSAQVSTSSGKAFTKEDKFKKNHPGL